MLDRETEREILQHGLTVAMRMCDEAMVLTDPHQTDNPILVANRAFCQLTLYDEQDFIGRNCRFLQGPSTDRQTVAQLAAEIARGSGCVQFLANYRKDRSVFWNLLFVSPILGRDGHLHFFFANQYDLTDGLPENMNELRLGPATLPPGKQTELRLLLMDIAQDTQAVGSTNALALRVRGLQSALHTARQIALLSTGLVPGAGER